MGGFIAGIGVFATVISLLERPDFSNLSVTLLWGIICGGASVTANLLLLSAMRLQTVGVVSTIYRLNMAGLVLGGYFFFDEPLNLYKAAGVIAVFAAIFCFYPKQQESRSRKFAVTGLIFAVAAMFFRILLGLFCKKAAVCGASADGVTFLINISWIIGGLFLLAVSGKKSKESIFSRRTLIYSGISGVLVYLILRTMTGLLEQGGSLSVNLTIAQMSFIPTFFMGVFFLKERFEMRRFAGAMLGIVSIILLSIP